MTASVAIVIVNYNGSAYVSQAIHSSLAQIYAGNIEVVVVDNASSDDSLLVLAKFPEISVIQSERNVGYGAGVNLALKSLSADFIALLNPDARADPHWIATMTSWMVNDRVDLGSCVIRAGSDIWFAGGRFFELIGATMVRHEFDRRTDWISGCALIATRSAFDALGGFDESFFLYYEDVDLCLRARAVGLSLAMMPWPMVSHPSEGRSTNALGQRKARIGYYARGRLIGKHVGGWKRVPALAFAALVSPIRNGVGFAELWPVAVSLSHGFLDAVGRRNKQQLEFPVRRSVGVLLNCYEKAAGLGAGGNRHFVEVVRRWTEFDLTLFGPRSAREAVLAELPDVQYVSLPSLENGSKGKALDFLYRSVASLVSIPRLRRCDVLLATSPFLPDIVPAVCSGRPVVAIIHHLIDPSGTAKRNSKIPYISEKLALLITKRFARAVVVSSNMLARELRRRRFRIPVVITTSGVDHIPATVDMMTQSRRNGALFVGRLHPAKGALDAVRAWRYVVDIEPTAVLTIIGTPEVEAYVREIEHVIRKIDLESNVVIRGKVSDAEKVEAMARASVFLFPSYEEGWGIALAEAMRARLPCVTYSLPIFDEIFPQGRLIANLGDIAGLANHVLTLLQNDHIRERLSSEAISLAADFSWDRASSIERQAVTEFFVS